MYTRHTPDDVDGKVGWNLIDMMLQESPSPQKSNLPIVFSFTMLATVHVYRFYSKFCFGLLFMFPIHRGKRNHQIRGCLSSLELLAERKKSSAILERLWETWSPVDPLCPCHRKLLHRFGGWCTVYEGLWNWQAPWWKSWFFWVGFLRDSWAKDILLHFLRQVWIHHSLQGE